VGSSRTQPITTPALHAKRSPSGYDWWGNCPGGPDFVEKLGVTRESGAAAEWGTVGHGHGEQAANYILGRRPDPPQLPAGDPAMKEVVEFYVNQLFNPTFEDGEEPLCDCNPKTWTVGVEEKLANPRLPEVWGTGDFVANCDRHGWLRVVDLKTGHGEVEAKDNAQCAIYALLALLSAKSKVTRVIIEIIQPRSPTGRRVKRWHLKPLELLELLPVYRRAVQRSLAPDAPLIAGEKQCRYCPAAPVCPERRKGVHRAALLQFGITRTYTPEDVAEALKLVPQLKDWVKNVESFAYQVANNGMKIPGYKLVQKRDGNREWKDEEQVIADLTPSGEDLWDRKLKSPAQLEKKFGKDAINELCKREPGGMVLVEDSDERKETTVNRKLPFQHLLKPTT
jgi:hypothetical protein